MTTQIIDQYQREVTTRSLSVSTEEGNTESEMNFYVPREQNLVKLPPIDFYDLCKKMGSVIRVDPVTESSVRLVSSMVKRQDAGQPETTSSGDQDQLSKHSAFNATVSQQVATELRTKEVRAFVPITAAELVRLDAQSEEMLEDNVVIRFPHPKKYTIQLRVKSVAKGKPRIVEPEELL